MRIVTKMAKAKINAKVWNSYSAEVELTEGVSAVYEKGALKVTGPKGEVSKKLKFPNVKISVADGKVIISTEKFSKNEKKIILTYKAHIANLVKGVTEGFEYKLSVVYAKFPMTVDANNGMVTVKNLLGEKVPRTYKIPSDVKVEVQGGKDITVTGIDKEKTGQVAASIEQLTRITHLDRRVIQDGIYIVEKPHRKYV